MRPKADFHHGVTETQRKAIAGETFSFWVLAGSWKRGESSNPKREGLTDLWFSPCLRVSVVKNQRNLRGLIFLFVARPL